MHLCTFGNAHLSHTWQHGFAVYEFGQCYSGRVDDLSFLEYLSPFCFLLIKFHCTFSISYEILPYFVVIGCDRLPGLLLFVPALPLSMLTLLFLPSSSVSLFYFVLAVPMSAWETTRA